MKSLLIAILITILIIFYNIVECVNVCRNPTIPVDHPWLRTFYEMKQKGMDKVAVFTFTITS